MGSWLMGSFGYWDQIEPDFSVTKTLFGFLIYVSSSISCWDHSVNGIILSLAQSDHIKPRPLYKKKNKLT
jgi:hypothetical protein